MKIPASYQEEIEDILKSYNLSHNFIVSYALACAKDVNPKPNKETLKCFELLDKWLLDSTSITNDELRDAAANAAYAAKAASNAAYYASNAAYYASNAAYYASNAAYAAAYYAANASASASSLDSAQTKYKELLLSLIRNKYGDIGLELMKVSNG